VTHLLEQQHERIAFVGGPMSFRQVADRYPRSETRSHAMLLLAQLELDGKRPREARAAFEALLRDPAFSSGDLHTAAEDGLIHAVKKGFRYLECSTVSPETTKRVQSALRAKGGDALEAPVTGSKNGADAGTLLFMTGGPRAVHDELMPVMMAMGTKAIYCGEMGQGSTMKLIGNHFISLMLEALAEGVVVGRKHGLPLETILEVVQASGFASPYFAFKGAAIGKRDWSEHFAIDLLVKDQTLMLETAAAARVPMPGLAAVREVFQSARAQGFGREDICAVVKTLERAAGESA